MKQTKDGRVYQRALNAARGSVSLIEKKGGFVASSYAEELVADTIAKIWLGVVAWNPDERDLLDLVISRVASRARDERKRAAKHPVSSLDAYEDGEADKQAAAMWAEAEDALAARVPTSNAIERLFTRDVFERLRALAVGDAEVLALLEAMRDGAVSRAELMEATTMTERRYERARRRLDTLLLALPASAAERVGALRPGMSAQHAA